MMIEVSSTSIQMIPKTGNLRRRNEGNANSNATTQSEKKEETKEEKTFEHANDPKIVNTQKINTGTHSGETETRQNNLFDKDAEIEVEVEVEVRVEPEAEKEAEKEGGEQESISQNKSDESATSRESESESAATNPSTQQSNTNSNPSSTESAVTLPASTSNNSTLPISESDLDTPPCIEGKPFHKISCYTSKHPAFVASAAITCFLFAICAFIRRKRHRKSSSSNWNPIGMSMSMNKRYKGTEYAALAVYDELLDDFDREDLSSYGYSHAEDNSDDDSIGTIISQWSSNGQGTGSGSDGVRRRIEMIPFDDGHLTLKEING